jgi:hypothetical protein
VKNKSFPTLVLLLIMLIVTVFPIQANAQPPEADISLTKTPSATKVVPGTAVSYLYNATNTGETALTGAIYDDQFGPVGSFVNLQPGGWVGFNVTHVITQNTTNTATAYGLDTYGQNVTDTATVTVIVCRSHFVVPEVPFGTIMVSASMILALTLFFAISKSKNKRKYIKP